MLLCISASRLSKYLFVDSIVTRVIVDEIKPDLEAMVQAGEIRVQVIARKD